VCIHSILFDRVCFICLGGMPAEYRQNKSQKMKTFINQCLFHIARDHAPITLRDGVDDSDFDSI
jgi:hypothetical protein